MIISSYLCFILISVVAQDLRPDQASNSPPVVLVDSNWKILEDEKVDTVIARVQARDDDPGDVFTFGLESSGNEIQPFRINRDTGVVYLNESLEGLGGKNFMVYVTVTDGTYHVID